MLVGLWTVLFPNVERGLGLSDAALISSRNVRICQTRYVGKWHVLHITTVICQALHLYVKPTNNHLNLWSNSKLHKGNIILQ